MKTKLSVHRGIFGESIPGWMLPHGSGCVPVVAAGEKPPVRRLPGCLGTGLALMLAVTLASSSRAQEEQTLTGDNPSVIFYDDVNPPQLWQILANHNGFRVRDLSEDFSGNVSPFVIKSGAPHESILIRDLGIVELNGSSSNSGGGTDLVLYSGGDSSCVFSLSCRDPVNGSSLNNWYLQGESNQFFIGSPFKALIVEKNAPTNALFLGGTGNVGIGTNVPSQIGAVSGVGKFFNVRADGATAATGVCNGIFQGTFGAQNHLVHLNGPADQKVMRLQCSSGFFGLHVLTDNLASKAVADCLSIKMSNGNVGLKVQNPAHPLHLASGAHVTAGGVFTNASSRELKQDIGPITLEQARETVRALQPVEYRYKSELEEQYVGFIAEDVPELVATKDRKSLAPMDLVAVLTKVVQEQDQQNEQQQQTIERQQQLLNTLTKRLDELERKLAASK